MSGGLNNTYARSKNYHFLFRLSKTHDFLFQHCFPWFTGIKWLLVLFFFFRYLTGQVRGGREETPCSRGQGGSQEEIPHVRGQWRPGGDTLCPRSGWPGGDTPRLRSGAAGRSHLTPEARGSSWEKPPHARGQGPQPGGATLGVVAAQEEGLEELSHIKGQERW